MNCQEIRERLPALIDKELEPAEQAEVEKHLAECPECQKEKSRQEKFTTSVKVSLEGLKPSDRFVKAVIAKLPEGDAGARGEQAAARKKTTVSLIVALIIIVLAVAIAAFHAARRKAEDEKRKPPVVPAPVQPEGRS